MDEAVGNVTRTLKEAGIYDDTVIVFASDVSRLLWCNMMVQWSALPDC